MRRALALFPRVAFYVAGAVAYFFALVALSAPAFGDEPGDVRGCYATFQSTTGKFQFEPFLKVKDKAAPSEDGEPEVWGFRPWNLEPPDENGKTKPVVVKVPHLNQPRRRHPGVSSNLSLRYGRPRRGCFRSRPSAARPARITAKSARVPGDGSSSARPDFLVAVERHEPIGENVHGPAARTSGHVPWCKGFATSPAEARYATWLVEAAQGYQPSCGDPDHADRRWARRQLVRWLEIDVEYRYQRTLPRSESCRIACKSNSNTFFVRS